MYKENHEYINNFNKKYYLCASLKKDSKEKNIILYHGSLKSILKYTTYKDGFCSVRSNKDLISILRKNLMKNHGVSLDFNNEEITFFMSSDKKFKNKTDVKYCDSREILFCNSMDVYSAIKPFMIKKDEFKSTPSQKVFFADFICKLIDKDYMSQLSFERKSHKATTKLDELRVIAYKVRYNIGLDIGFTKFMLYDSYMLKTALEYICKDLIKKEKLLNEVYKLTQKNYVLSEDTIMKRSWDLTNELKKNCESRKYVENKMYNAFKENGLVISINPVLPKKEIVSYEREDVEVDEIELLLKEYSCNTYEELQKKLYEEYLNDSGIMHNDAGEPLLDQDYDIEDKPKK